MANKFELGIVHFLCLNRQNLTFQYNLRNLLFQNTHEINRPRPRRSMW